MKYEYIRSFDAGRKVARIKKKNRRALSIIGWDHATKAKQSKEMKTQRDTPASDPGKNTKTG